MRACVVDHLLSFVIGGRCHGFVKNRAWLPKLDAWSCPPKYLPSAAAPHGASMGMYSIGFPLEDNRRARYKYFPVKHWLVGITGNYLV